MSNHLKNADVSLIGAGPMAVAYARVLAEQQVDFQVIGRSASSAESFQQETGIEVRPGGVERWLANASHVPEAAIVAVGPQELAATTHALMRAGARRILLEKPGALTFAELDNLVDARQQHNADVYVAYNRRHYASTLRAEELIAQDGGVMSFRFDFTEWSHRLQDSGKPAVELAQWFFLNSSHVVDLAFYLGGRPVSMQSWASGGLEWHSAASVFCGGGVTQRDALFSYHANWEAPGRWGVDLMTPHHRIVLCPLEGVKVQRHGSLEPTEVSLDDELDRRFKPGFYRQIEEFLASPADIRSPSLDEHHELWKSVLSPIVTPVSQGNLRVA